MYKYFKVGDESTKEGFYIARNEYDEEEVLINGNSMLEENSDAVIITESEYNTLDTEIASGQYQRVLSGWANDVGYAAYEEFLESIVDKEESEDPAEAIPEENFNKAVAIFNKLIELEVFTVADIPVVLDMFTVSSPYRVAIETAFATNSSGEEP